jgi:predicted dehydrogenase
MLTIAARGLICAFMITSMVGLAMAVENASTSTPAKKIRVGIIGLDTSHVSAFTKAINNPKAVGELADLQIVAAFPGGSADIPTSASRVAGFTAELRDRGVEIVDSIDALLTKVDAVLLESVDGRPHLEQVRPVIAAKKPVFIDKPAAGSLADAIEIYRLAREAGVPCFSSSSLRFSPEIQAARHNPNLGEVLGCMAYSPCSLEPHHPDLFWYGIHGVEMLYTIMGPGCVSVNRVHTADTDVVTGVWKDGRVGTFRGLRGGKPGYGGTVFGSKGIGPAGTYGGYEPMLVEIAKFFKTGKPPVTAEETIEILAFMEAADESKRQGGGLVTIESVMAKARAVTQGK